MFVPLILEERTVLTFRRRLGTLTRFMAQIIEEQFVLEIPSGFPLRGDLRWSKELADSHNKSFPIVIVCHGFKAFKDWGPFPAIGRYFAQHGFVSIVLNFSHNGIGKEPKKFVEHEKFANNTISLEIEDVKTVLKEISGNCFGYSFIDRSKIGLVGHSKGGAVSLITAKEDKRVKAVVAWSTIAHFDRYTDEQRRRWREEGFVQLHSVSSQQLFRINTTLLDDVENNVQRLDIIKAAEDLRKPLLIVHGTADIPAKIEEAERIYKAANKLMTQFVKLEGVGHMYGAKHPYRNESPTLNHVLEITSNWLHTNLYSEV